MTKKPEGVPPFDHFPLTIAADSTDSSKTKHIARRCFFLKPLRKGRVSINFVGAHDKLAHTTTKHLAKNAFNSIIHQTKDFSR